MKKYVVGILSYYDNYLKQFKVEADSSFDALKLGMLEFTSVEYKQGEVDFQNSDMFPKTFEEAVDFYYNADIVVSVIEI